MTSPSRSARYGGAMMSGPNLTSGLTSGAGRRARAIDLDDLDGPDAGDLASLADLGDAPQPSPVDMVVFDIGNVLVRWEPRAALLDAVGEDAATALLTDPELDFFAHNLAADGGRAWREIVAEIDERHPHHTAAAQAYIDNFHLAIAEPIAGSVAIVRELAEAGVPLFALTNFSAELFEVARSLHGDVLDLFEEIIVSGEEGVTKPDPEIWEILEEVTRHRGGLSDAVFIDDSAANVMGAEQAGLDAILFTDPDTLRDDLRLRGLPLEPSAGSRQTSAGVSETPDGTAGAGAAHH